MNARQAFHRIKETLVCADYVDGQVVSVDSILDKEQDILEVLVIREGGATSKRVPGIEYGYDEDVYICGNCDMLVDEYDWEYCPLCGYKIRRGESNEN